MFAANDWKPFLKVFKNLVSRSEVERSGASREFGIRRFAALATQFGCFTEKIVFFKSEKKTAF
jgi:hypothetical protein